MSIDRHGLEEAVIHLLSELSPADVVQSKAALETCLRDFLARGTVEDSLKLLPQLHKNIILSTALPEGTRSIDTSLSLCRSSSTPAFSRPTPLPASEPLSPCRSPSRPIFSTSPCRSSSGLNSPILTRLPTEDTPFRKAAVVEYFELKDVCIKKATELARLIQSFTEATVLPLESYESLWIDRTNIFNSDIGTRVQRLRRGRQNIENNRAEDECAARLALMYSVHEADIFLQTSTRGISPLRNGLNKKGITLNIFAQIHNIPKDELHSDRHKSRPFFQLMKMAGPGVLLELENNTASYWERASAADIDLLLEYRRMYLPVLSKRGEELNRVAARTIIKGLGLYGWDSAEIESSPSPFLVQVRDHLEGNGCPCEGRTGSICRACKETSSKKRKADDALDSNSQISKKQADTVPSISTLFVGTGQHPLPTQVVIIDALGLNSVRPIQNGEMANVYQDVQESESGLGVSSVTGASNGNLQGLNSHLGGTPGANVEYCELDCGDLQYQDSNTGSLGNPNLSSLQNPTEPNYNHANDLGDFYREYDLNSLVFNTDSAYNLYNPNPAFNLNSYAIPSGPGYDIEILASDYNPAYAPENDAFDPNNFAFDCNHTASNIWQA